MQNKEYTTIRVTKKTQLSIARIAKKFDSSMIDFVGSMVKYFEVTGVNPKDQKVLSPAEELKKFRDTIISFFRTQEKEYIMPVFGKMDTLIVRMVDYIENEAPKRSDKNTSSFALETMQNEKKEDHYKEGDFSTIEIPDGRVAELEMQLSTEKQKVINAKFQMSKIFKNYDYKSTGLQKKIVVEMSQNEFEDINKVIKLM